MNRALALALLTAVALAGCGGGGDSKPELKVSAAASLKAALTDYGNGITDAVPRFNFGGSDVLAAQIRAGARPDVYAAANAKLPEALAASGLVGRPVAFARNRLVIGVPAASAKIHSVQDLARPGLRLVIGSPTVPIGSYTRQVLAKLPAALRAKILAAVRSQEPDVSGIVGKLGTGAVDGGFVYISDVRAAGGRLKAIQLPDSLEPEVVYEAAVVRSTKHPEQARAFIAGLRGPAGQRALRAAGFLPPP